MAIPITIGVAVMRYRLYEIDTIINRTLVYAGLTATLALTYVAFVALLQVHDAARTLESLPVGCARRSTSRPSAST